MYVRGSESGWVRHIISCKPMIALSIGNIRYRV